MAIPRRNLGHMYFMDFVFVHFWKSDVFKVGGGRDLMEHGKKI